MDSAKIQNNKTISEQVVAPEQTIPAKKYPIFKIRKSKIILVLSALLIVSLGISGYLAYKIQKLEQSALLHSQPQDELSLLIAKIGRLMTLPEGEVPTLATVTDAERLKDQPFFANAKKGYKVLIYSTAKKAILYDPENDKIIEVAPINLGGSLPSTSPSPSPSISK